MRHSPYVWQQTILQAVRDLDSPVTLDDFDILARPGQLLMLCLWLHSQLVYLLALKQASKKERDIFRQESHYQGSIIDQRVEMQRENLGSSMAKFKCAFGDELTHDDLLCLEQLKDVHNGLVHCFFSLHSLDNRSGFVTYASNHRDEKDIVWKFNTDESAARSLMKDFLELGECFHKLCRTMNIDYDRVL